MDVVASMVPRAQTLELVQQGLPTPAGLVLAVSGATAVLGARGDDDAGTFSGSAYVFNNVPEPATGLLLALGSLALLRRRRTVQRDRVGIRFSRFKWAGH